MTGSRRSSLPYDMGNAGDLLKHGVLAEFVRWRIERNVPVRFLDLFAGEPFACVTSETVQRVRSLAGSALAEMQAEIGKGRYFGSSRLFRNLEVPVVVNDCNLEFLKKLLRCDLLPLNKAFPDDFSRPDNDAYAAFEKIARKVQEKDVALIDPFGEFLLHRTKTIIPQMKEMMNRGAAVVLFALNLDPGNRVATRFDGLLKDHLGGAWRMTCPPLPHGGIRGESRYHAEVVLASRDLCRDCPDTAALKARLEDLARNLAKVLCLRDDDARMLMPRVVDEDTTGAPEK